MVQTLSDLSVKYLARQIGQSHESAQKSGTQTGEMQEELKDDLQSLPDHLQRKLLHSVDPITFDYIRSLPGIRDGPDRVHVIQILHNLQSLASMHPYLPYKYGITKISFTEDNSRIFTLAHGCLRVWDLSGDAARRIAQYTHVYEAEFESRDVLIMNNEDGTVTAEFLGDRRPLRRTILSDQFKDKGCCLISISPRFVMIADQEDNLLCWGRRTMRLQQSCVLDGYVPLRGCISPDGERAVGEVR